jgi:DNA polymerase III epsilon subunit family exonuclease
VTPEGIQILDEIFPGREIPAGLKDLLSTIPVSRPDLLKASPARLVPPFSLPGLEEMLRRLTEDLQAGRGLDVLPGDSPDGPAAISLLNRVFKSHRKNIRPMREPGRGEGPVLEFDIRDGLRYLGGDRVLALSPDGPGGERYSAAGLVFKLGQGQQLTAENGFGRRYVAFDLETTGKDPRRDEIIEIGAVRISGGVAGEEFSALVKPSRSLPRLITEITGISDRDLENAPPLEEVLPKFLDFIGEDTLVAHNIEFDYAFLKRAARRILKRRLANETFCTLVAARARMPGQSHRLGAVAESLGIELKDWHRATADARAAAEIFLRFQEEDNAPKRFDYFRKTVDRACLGALLARVPISGDNAVFFRHGWESLLGEYRAGERYFRRRPGSGEKIDRRLPADLDSWWRKKRGRAVYRLVEQAVASPRQDDTA